MASVKTDATLLLLSAAAAILAMLLFAGPAHARQGRGPQHELTVKVIHATKSNAVVDPKLKELAKDLKELKELKFTSYRLEDEAKFELELQTSGRMQLPDGEWLTIRPTEVLAAKGMLRIIIEVEKLEFKATVAIARGATVVVPGPPFKNGRLLLAVTRVKI